MAKEKSPLLISAEDTLTLLTYEEALLILLYRRVAAAPHLLRKIGLRISHPFSVGENEKNQQGTTSHGLP